MLKTRLIPVLNIMNGLIVRSELFKVHQNIGNVINEATRYNEWQVDELIYLDISRDKNYDSRRDDHKIKSYDSIHKIIQEISKVCFMPLTFGGGIRTLEDVDMRIRHGADKVILNTGAIDSPELVKQVSKKYGAQCVVISIDYRMLDNRPIVYSHFGSVSTQKSVFEWITEVEKLGAGEVFLNSIERDGTGDGYDLDVIGHAVESTRLPVIACGGAGDFYDFVELAKKTKVSAVAAGNIFHFTENAYPRSKKLLREEKVNVR